MTTLGSSPCDAGIIQSRPTAAPCTPRQGRWVLSATILGSSMAFIDGTVVNVALPTLQRDLGATATEAQWVVQAYALLLAALILVGGSLGDHLGRRRIYMLGIALFTLASVGCGLAQSTAQLIAARMVQGIGGAMVVPGSLAIISASFQGADRGRAIGTWSAFSAITAALGPVIGGYLIENVSWRAIFFLNVPLAVAVLLIAWRYVPESRDESARRIDVWGALLATVGLGALTYGLTEASARGFGDGRVLAALAVGVVGLLAFVVVEARLREPMVPLEVFRSRTFRGANLLTLLLYAGLGGALFFVPFNLIQVQGYTPTQAGLTLLPFTVITFTLSRWAGGLVARYGARRLLMLGPTIAAGGFALYALPGVGGSYWTTFFPAIIVLALGMTFVIAPLTTTVMNAIAGNHAGLASGINNAVSRVGGLLAVAVFGIVLAGVFNVTLSSRLDTLDLPLQARQAIDAERVNLAGAAIPATLAQTTQAQVRAALDDAFVAGFRTVMLVACGLALASAVCAAVLLEDTVP